MTLHALQLIPASAGSGKTFRLKEQLKEWVIDDNSGVSAESIVAVTFTEAAAAELRQRIRGALLQAGRIDDAARLDEAYVSTIHGFGLRILRESAFDLGSALSPRLLTEDEQQQLMRKALGASNQFDKITKDLARYGYTYNHNTKQSAEDVFRSSLLKIISLLRSTGNTRAIDEHIHDASAWIASRYGKPHVQSNEELAAQLRTRAQSLLNAFPEALTKSHGTSQSARNDFSANFDALKAALQFNSLENDWALWKKLGALRVSNKQCKTPDGYDALAEAVIETAARLAYHPGPLASAQEHIEMLLRGGTDAMQRFADSKKESGLLDYTDMVAGAFTAVCDPNIATQLRDRVDCMVVDEFQDTNPIQFGLLWRLTRLGLPTTIVGDVKQSIMGFQGADTRLFQALVQNFPDAATPLEHNWRSQPDLLAIINATSKSLFPDYTALAPQAPASKLPALHVLVCKGEKGTKTHPWRAARVVAAIQKKLDDPKYLITDRHTKQERRLKGGDCAVLCPTHSMLKQYAQALRDKGIRVRLKQDGWLQSTEIQIALQALALAHNPNDKHARLYLAVTALGSHTLEDALRTLVAGEVLTDAAFADVMPLTAAAATTPIDHLVPDVLRALGIYDAVMLWPDSRQARANLLKLEGLAQEYVDAQPESLMAAGIHGYGLPQFLAWVKQKAERDSDMPSASVIDEDAVELVTWHAAKGREWPLVAVCGMAQKKTPYLPEQKLGYADFSDLDNLIQSASLEFSPQFDSADTNTRFTDQLTSEFEEQVLREIYVAISRPRDQLLLEWPLDALDGNSPTRASLLQDRAEIQLNEDSITICGDAYFKAIIEYAEPDDCDTTAAKANLLPNFGRRSLLKQKYSGALIADSRAPSKELHPSVDGKPPPFKTVRYADPLELEPGPDPLDIGDFVHRYFEVDDDTDAGAMYLQALAHDLWPEHGDSICSRVTKAKRNFNEMLSEDFIVSEIDNEVPIIGLDSHGVVVNGVIDLLATTPSGLLLIDHKTDREQNLNTIVARHATQLSDYADVLGVKTIRHTAINAVVSGCLLVMTHGVEQA